MAPISAKYDFVYKWDFIEGRYKCEAEHRMLLTMEGRLPREELVQFMRKLHKIKFINPKDKRKTLIIYQLIALIFRQFKK